MQCHRESIGQRLLTASASLAMQSLFQYFIYPSKDQYRLVFRNMLWKLKIVLYLYLQIYEISEITKRSVTNSVYSAREDFPEIEAKN